MSDSAGHGRFASRRRVLFDLAGEVSYEGPEGILSEFLARSASSASSRRRARPQPAAEV